MIRNALTWMSLGCAGCASVALPRAGHDAPVRHVVRSGQFVFTTDFPFSPNDPAVGELTQLRDALHRKLRLQESQDPIRIIIFENKQHYDEFVRLNYPELPARRALFVKQGEGDLVLYACRGKDLLHDLRHEAAHALLHASLPRVPLWLDEGLAEYFECSTESKGVNRRHLAALIANPGWRPDLLRLEGLTRLDDMSAHDYREAWLWAHYLLDGEPAAQSAFRDYLAACAKAEAAPLSTRLGTLSDPSQAVLRHLATLAAVQPRAQ